MSSCNAPLMYEFFNLVPNFTAGQFIPWKRSEICSVGLRVPCHCFSLVRSFFFFIGPIIEPTKPAAVGALTPFFPFSFCFKRDFFVFMVWWEGEIALWTIKPKPIDGKNMTQILMLSGRQIY